jgi:hypothetical protein
MGVAMPAKSRTAYFTKRGKHFGNLWAVYSTKMNQVILLGSDRQLAHWLLYLEFSCDVISFQFNPTFKAVNSGSLDRLDYHVEVNRREGMVELHYLRVTGRSENYADKLRAAEKIKYKYIEFSDEDWTPKKGKLLSLLRLASFLSGGRHTYIPVGLDQTAMDYVSYSRKGTLQSFLSALSSYDRSLALLVFCRMHSTFLIDVDFDSSIFNKDTLWWIYEA